MVRFGFSGSPFAAVHELVDTAVRTERVGFDTFLVADLPGALSPLLALAAAARATSTLRVGTFVLNTGL
jgi:alkanesulfonate monooxygenase SsuD/methylene tetrahydromethanopterin reductase-like flavin-dependent oxidoreductase (luciferase family)